MTCDELEAVVLRLPDVTSSELLASFAHFKNCPACREKAIRLGSRVDPKKIPVLTEMGKDLANKAKAAAATDPELKPRKRGEP